MKSSILHYKTVQISPKNKLKLSEILLMMERLIITKNILSLRTILMETGFMIFIMLKEIFIKNQNSQKLISTEVRLPLFLVMIKLELPLPVNMKNKKHYQKAFYPSQNLQMKFSSVLITSLSTNSIQEQQRKTVGIQIQDKQNPLQKITIQQRNLKILQGLYQVRLLRALQLGRCEVLLIMKRLQEATKKEMHQYGKGEKRLQLICFISLFGRSFQMTSGIVS